MSKGIVHALRMGVLVALGMLLFLGSSALLLNSAASSSYDRVPVIVGLKSDKPEFKCGPTSGGGYNCNPEVIYFNLTNAGIKTYTLNEVCYHIVFTSPSGSYSKHYSFCSAGWIDGSGAPVNVTLRPGQVSSCQRFAGRCFPDYFRFQSTCPGSWTVNVFLTNPKAGIETHGLAVAVVGIGPKFKDCPN